MPGLTLDGNRAHQIFAHAAPGRLDHILDFHNLPRVGPVTRHHCCDFGRLRRSPTRSTTRNATTARHAHDTDDTASGTPDATTPTPATTSPSTL